MELLLPAEVVKQNHPIPRYERHETKVLYSHVISFVESRFLDPDKLQTLFNLCHPE
jgi:hypothetical protein